MGFLGHLEHHASKDEKRSNKKLHLPSLCSLHMERCALSLLGRCDKEALSNRCVTASWSTAALLTEEEKTKVLFRPLCSNHGTHPERLRQEIQTPPLKRVKSDPPVTPSSQKISSRCPGSAPVSPPNSGGEKLCNGVNNRDLEEFIAYKYGFTFSDEEGYPWGEKLRGWSTYRARLCARVVLSKKERCDECHRLHHAMLCARTRDSNSAREGTQKYIPTSALKVSPYVRDLIEEFRKENKPHPQNEEKENEEDIEVEVCLFISSTQVHTMMYLLIEPGGQRLSCQSVPKSP